jgi:hypothetical protein
LVSYRLINRKYLSLVYEAESKPAGASGVLTLVSQTTKSMRIANAVRVIGVEIMKIALQITKSEASQNGQEYLSVLQNRQTRGVFFDIGMREVLYLLVAAALLTVLSVTARSQTLVAVPAAPPSTESNAISVQPSSPYARPTQRTMARNYVFDAFGPYPIAGALFTAGINQFGNSPPEWNQGVEGYSKRFGSDYGIAAVGTTARYALAEAFKEDTLYYRCECSGVLPRLRHAAISTLTARRGEDGHRVFSFPALVAPYVGSMTAVYGWYPNRFGAKDAFRTGNYSMLAFVAGNISLEFFYSGPHSLFSRMHLNNAHGSPVEGPNK